MGRYYVTTSMVNTINVPTGNLRNTLKYRVFKCNYYYFLRLCGPARAMASSSTRFRDLTQRHATVGRTPQDEWSACRRDLYLTTHNTHNKHPCPPLGFEPTLAAGERSYTYALDRAATGPGVFKSQPVQFTAVSLAPGCNFGLPDI
jgi:hypothetical protein